jgi:acetyl-CoA synthetase (ADP-forming)
LADLILKISKLIEENPQIKELELNPIVAFADGAVALDARIILEKEDDG